MRKADLANPALVKEYKRKYYDAWGYAFKVSKGKDYKDLVHDAYLRWYNKTGQDLFLEHRGTIARVIHYIWLGWIKKNQVMIHGEMYTKVHKSKDEEDGPEQISRVTPEDILIHKEQSQYKSVSESPYHQEVVRLLMLGYSHKEITEKLNLNPNTVSRHLVRYRKGFQEYINS